MRVDHNPLVQLNRLGQSVWLDFIERKLIDSGELATLVRDDDLRGLTSNPAIFEKAIAESGDYTRALSALALSHDGDAKAIYEGLAVRDIRDACDLLRPVYDETATRDGYASLEVAPNLAFDTAGQGVKSPLGRNTDRLYKSLTGWNTQGDWLEWKIAVPSRPWV